MSLPGLAAVQLSILGSVAMAMLLGGLVGLDREIERKPAGLRTHILVAGAAAFLVSIGEIIVAQYDRGLQGDMLRTDPVRIIEAVITGVSFLGAGTIIREKGGVSGLTTAASLLFVAALGVAVAVREYVLATGVTGLILLTLRGLGYLEDRLRLRRSADAASPRR